MQREAAPPATPSAVNLHTIMEEASRTIGIYPITPSQIFNAAFVNARHENDEDDQIGHHCSYEEARVSTAKRALWIHLGLGMNDCHLHSSIKQHLLHSSSCSRRPALSVKQVQRKRTTGECYTIVNKATIQVFKARNLRLPTTPFFDRNWRSFGRKEPSPCRHCPRHLLVLHG